MAVEARSGGIGRPAASAQASDARPQRLVADAEREGGPLGAEQVGQLVVGGEHRHVPARPADLAADGEHPAAGPQDDVVEHPGVTPGTDEDP